MKTKKYRIDSPKPTPAKGTGRPELRVLDGGKGKSLLEPALSESAPRHYDIFGAGEWIAEPSFDLRELMPHTARRQEAFTRYWTTDWKAPVSAEEAVYRGHAPQVYGPLELIGLRAPQEPASPPEAKEESELILISLDPTASRGESDEYSWEADQELWARANLASLDILTALPGSSEFIPPLNPYAAAFFLAAGTVAIAGATVGLFVTGVLSLSSFS